MSLFKIFSQGIDKISRLTSNLWKITEIIYRRHILFRNIMNMDSFLSNESR